MPTRSALLLTILLALTAPSSTHAQNAPSPALPDTLNIATVDMGTMPGQRETRPAAINDAGVVVGVATDDRGTPTAFMWEASRGFSAIVAMASATDINNHNVVVGVLQYCDGMCPHGFLWTEENGFRDLGSFVPWAVNDDGHMAGACVVDNVSRACLMVDGDVRELGLDGIAFDINNDDVAVGTGFVAQGGGSSPYAFSWSSTSGIRHLHTPITRSSQASGVNASGAVTGDLIVAGRPNSSAVVWHGTTRDLLTGHYFSSGSAINDAGWVAGLMAEEGLPYRPLLWIPNSGGVELPVPAGLQGWFASDINNRNQIVGSGYQPDGIVHAILWTITGRLPQTLQISTPNTPARWGIGSTQRIAWSYSGTAPHFRIEISYDAARTWETIALEDNHPGRSQSFYWTVAGTSTRTARVRVTGVGDPAATDVNDAHITIEPARIELYRPTRKSGVTFGQSIVIGFRHDLGARVPVAIDVSADGGRTWRPLIVTETKGSQTSTITWTVDVPPTDDARLRVRALDGSGVTGASDGFSVRAAAQEHRLTGDIFIDNDLNGGYHLRSEVFELLQPFGPTTPCVYDECFVGQSIDFSTVVYHLPHLFTIGSTEYEEGTLSIALNAPPIVARNGDVSAPFTLAGTLVTVDDDVPGVRVAFSGRGTMTVRLRGEGMPPGQVYASGVSFHIEDGITTVTPIR
jgi:probable HAF family extracellular repeat protein